MARTYLFFRPARLPLAPGELDAATVLHIEDTPQLRPSLERVFPGVSWNEGGEGRATLAGEWYELQLPASPADTLSLRCSLRAQHDAVIQGVCDRLGWLAFDDQPLCFQPHRPPMPA